MVDRYTRKIYRETDIAYLAGIIDGEGSITIGNYSSNKKTGDHHYQTILSITNTDYSLLEWIKNTFGGSVWAYSEKQTPKNSRQKYYRYVATGNLLTHICELVLPYCICKKKQVEIMLEMRATYKAHSAVKGKQGTQPISKEILEFRHQCLLRLRDLHTRKGSLNN